MIKLHVCVGTGKTRIAVKIACQFVNKRNRVNRQVAEPGSREQVLFCGPSNSSVDVIAGDNNRFLIAASR